MAGLFDRQAEVYADARPTYPPEWYARLSELTGRHDRAWDAGTGNGQAAVSVAEHYDHVIATDVSDAQLKLASPHPKVRYCKTTSSISEEELVSLVGGEDSIDLITVAQAVHWFNLPTFYAAVNRVLRKPRGVIAVWGYSEFSVNPAFDAVQKRFYGTTIPYWDRNIQLLFNGYRSLPFPFDPVGFGCEGSPIAMDMKKDTSFHGLMGVLRSWSAVVKAKDQGVDLLSDSVLEEMEKAWGGSNVVREVTYKIFMLAGTPRIKT